MLRGAASGMTNRAEWPRLPLAQSATSGRAAMPLARHRSGSRLVFGVQPTCAWSALGLPQLIGFILISGVMTGVTAGAMRIGFIGAAALIAGLRFAAFFFSLRFFPSSWQLLLGRLLSS